MARFVCVIKNVTLHVTNDAWHSYSAVLTADIAKIQNNENLVKNLLDMKSKDTEVICLGYQQKEEQDCFASVITKNGAMQLRLEFVSIGQDGLDNMCKGRVFIVDGIAFLSTTATVSLHLAPDVKYVHDSDTYLWFDLCKRESTNVWQDQLRGIVNLDDLKDYVFEQDDKFIPYVEPWVGGVSVEPDREYNADDQNLEDAIEYSTSGSDLIDPSDAVPVKDTTSSKLSIEQQLLNQLTMN